MAKRGRPKKTKISKEKVSIVVLLLVVAVFGISVVYAALSSTLSVTTGTVTQSTLSWSVGFNPGTVTGTAGGTSATGRSCGNATVTATTVTVADTTLSKPDDSCTYALVIKNTGGIDATLSNITAVSPTSVSCTNSGASMVCGNITYKLTTDPAGQTLLATGGTLAKTSGTRTIYLVVKFTGSSMVSSAITHNNGGFTLVYSQA